MQPIIGLDFGNFNTFTCFVTDFSIEKSRMGGIMHNLIPANKDKEGIPSVYFYSGKTGNELVGYNAVREGAKPIKNRLRYLKCNLGETEVIDGKTISYDHAITAVVQYCIRVANQQMQQGYLCTTNLVSLAYPATFSHVQKQKLIELVEKAKLEDGTPVKVFGIIAEPAAAALDYLADFAKSTKESTVLTYDLGGGTFDLGLVSVYPEGRKSNSGHTYYYDIVNTGGIPKLGGKDFTDVLFNILRNKFKVSLTSDEEAKLRNVAETTKINLSDLDCTEEFVEFLYRGDPLQTTITRIEYENACSALVDKTIKETQRFLLEKPYHKPDMILLTGGASQMPYIEKAMKAAFPQYRVEKYRPNYAIAYGAARFGCTEIDTDGSTESGPITKRLEYDIGIKYVKDKYDDKGYVHILLNKGTAIPCSSECYPSRTVTATRYSSFSVYEAVKTSPDVNKISEDFVKIMSVEVDHGRIVPEKHPNEARLSVGRNEWITVEARDTSIPNSTFKSAKCKLEHLSGR